MHVCQYKIVHCHFAAGCSPPSSPVNGSVSEFTSSRVGAQVTYSFDPGYSLHGSTTSQCVSGEWTPSPETVMCVAIDQSEWNFSICA